tara:strand:- start:2831 stop:3790 length:960 start_codon:yes stop_codon:yes gene_type:complete
MKVLLAGGAGYIGTLLSEHLSNNGFDVTVVDLFWFGDYLCPSVKKVKANILDLQISDVKGFDSVVFLGGLSNDPMANFSPKANFIENAATPSYLAYICKEAGVKRFVYASSCSVYGFTDNQIMTETSPVSPQYPYGICKLQTEYSIMKMKDNNFRPISLRKGTVGGWSPRMRFDLVVNTMTKFALTQGKIVVHNPSLWRPLVDIRDVVQAYEKSITADLEISEVFNICSKNYTIGSLAEEVRMALHQRGIEVAIDTRDTPDARNYLASNEKAIKYLKFKPRHEPRDSVFSILNNIQNINFDNKKYYNIRVFKEVINEAR